MAFSFLLVSVGAGAQSIDGVPIGSTLPSTGKFTNLEATTQITLGAETITNFSGLDDDKVKVSSGDTADFLESQIVGGTGVTVNSDGSQITISAPPVNVEDSADGVEITFANEGATQALDLNGTDLFQGTTDPSVTVGGVSYNVQAKGSLSSGQQVIVTPPSGRGRAGGHHKLKLSNANGFSEGLILLDEILIGNDEFTKLLLHFDGNFNDVASGATNPPHTVTAVGNAGTVSTPDSPLTPDSDVATFDGTGDYLSVPDSDDWDFGNSDFTMDAWIYPTDSTADEQTIIAKDFNGLTYGFIVNFAKQGQADGYKNLGIIWSINGTSFENPTRFNSQITPNNWYHIAIVRLSNTITVYVDGSSIGSYNSVGSFNDTANNLLVGAYDPNTGYFKGQIDEVHISKGVARFTGNFTPPAAPYN